MLETFLKPIKSKEEYSKEVEKLLESLFYYDLYKPIYDIIQGKDVREQAKSDPLITAIKSGKIFYADGYMFGSFSASTSKRLKELGGRFNKTRKGFDIPLQKLSPEIRSAIADKKHKQEEIIKKIDDHITKVKEKVPTIEFKPYTQKVLQDLHVQFKKVTPESLQIPFEINDHTRKRLEELYEEDLNNTIKGWHEEAIERLRKKVEQNVAAGFRADKLISAVQQEHETTKKKARVIAKQESSLLVSKYRQVRYEEAGVTSYRWSSSQDERVRKDHRDLNNRIFKWNDPPIVDKATGRRAHPGEDYGCRCVALPVIKGIL